MDQFSFPTSTNDIDRCKEKKINEMILVYVLGGAPLSK